jgi:hypothetical protein
MIEIRVDSDIEKLTAMLTDLQRRQLPFATAAALTDVAKSAQSNVQRVMRSVFDRPTPFTLGGTFVQPATKQRLASAVFFKDQLEAGKGVPAGKYLAAEISGGQRAQTRFERSLVAAGLMPSGYYVVPGKDEALDPYGNVKRGLFTQILSDLRAFGEQGFKANRITKRTARQTGKRYRESRFFVVRPGKRAQPGIYRIFKFASLRGVRPVFIFARGTSYRARLDFSGIVQRTVRAEFSARFSERLTQALATAR